jgi:hypothetical protein
MKKILFLVMISIAASHALSAQKGKNQVSIGGEIAFPTGAFGESCKTGFGGNVKFLNGVGNVNQVSFSFGYTSFSIKGSSSQASASYAIIPILLGYRHNIIGGLYVEPQAGYGSYHIRVSTAQGSASDSQGAFTYAVGMAYVVSDIDFGVRFQNGVIDGDNFSNFAVKIGYNFSLKAKSSK